MEQKVVFNNNKKNRVLLCSYFWALLKYSQYSIIKTKKIFNFTYLPL